MGEQVNARQWREGRPSKGYRPDRKEMQDVGKQGKVKEGTAKARKCKQGVCLVRQGPGGMQQAGQGWGIGMGMQGNARLGKVSRLRQGNC